jgi:hypothetical protein
VEVAAVEVAATWEAVAAVTASAETN